MALLGVINSPNQGNQESGFDKVVKGLQVAGQLIGVGDDIARTYNSYQNTKLDAQKQNVQDKLFQADFAQKFTPTTPDDPNKVIDVDISGDGNKTPYKLRSEGLRPSDAVQIVNLGMGSLIDDNAAKQLVAQGKQVNHFGTGLNLILDPNAVSLKMQKSIADLAKTNAETDKLKAEALNAGNAKQTAREQFLDTRATDLAKAAADPTNRVTLGRYVAQVDRSNNVLTLIDANNPEWNKLSDDQKADRLDNLLNSQRKEVVRGLATVINQGALGAESGIEGLDNDSTSGQLKALYQKLTGEPTATGQGKLILPLIKSLENERKSAASRLGETLDQLGVGYQDLAKERPEQFRKLIYGGLRGRLDQELNLNNGTVDVPKTPPASSTAPPAPAAPSSTSSPSFNLKVGTVEDHHEFLGGDPRDPKSWKKLP